ncbi:MAG: hypothetical protein HC909_01140 [Blastochloris sp.]|nr:hypothetical protein [Blastochloris sp.]
MLFAMLRTWTVKRPWLGFRSASMRSEPGRRQQTFFGESMSGSASGSRVFGQIVS